MASIRNLKKDIDFLVSQVVVDCFLYNRYSKDAREDASHKIMEEVLGLGMDLRKRVNLSGKIDDLKERKNHYRTIGRDLLAGCDQAYTKLAKLMDQDS